MSWLSSMWDNNRDFLGNAVKNVAPVAGVAASLLSGGALSPLMAAFIGGGGAALGQGMQKGSSIGDILKTGASNAAIAGGGAAAGNGLMSAFAPSSAAAAAPSAGSTLATGSLPSMADAPSAMSLAPASADAATATSGTAPLAAGTSAAGKSIGQRLLDSAGDVGSWAAKHPETVGQGLSAIGGAPLNEAQARRIALQNQEDEYALARKKAQDQALDPLRAAFAAQMQKLTTAPRYTPAPNPYAPRG